MLDRRSFLSGASGSAVAIFVLPARAAFPIGRKRLNTEGFVPFSQAHNGLGIGGASGKPGPLDRGRPERDNSGNKLISGVKTEVVDCTGPNVNDYSALG